MSGSARHMHALRYAAMRDVVVAATRASWLGRLAAELGLDYLIDRIHDDRDAVELAIYRAHHARAVRHASPVALDLLRHEGFDPDALAMGLRPNGSDRRWLCGRRPPRSPGALAAWGSGTALPAEDEHDFLHGGLIVAAWDEPRPLGIRLSLHGLEVGGEIGGVHLRSTGSLVSLTVGGNVPETIKAAAVGRPVDGIFGHPMLNGRGYVITWSGDHGDESGQWDDEPPAWRVVFRADPVAWRVPWAVEKAGTGHGIRSEVERS